LSHYEKGVLKDVDVSYILKCNPFLQRRQIIDLILNYLQNEIQILLVIQECLAHLVISEEYCEDVEALVDQFATNVFILNIVGNQFD